MSEEIEKFQSGPLAVPDFLKGVSGQEGLENATREDMILPRLAVCQAMSPQRKRSNPGFIEGLQDGQLFNTVTKEIYGDGVTIIPIVYSKSRIYFRPITSGGGIQCQSFNGIDGGTIAPTCAECPNSQFGSEGEPPACNVFMNVVAALMPRRELIVLSFKSTELKTARAWVTLMKARNKPAFSQVFGVRVIEQSNQKGTFFTRVIDWKRFVDAGEFAYAKAEYESIRGKAIQTDEGHEQAADAGADEEPPF